MSKRPARRSRLTPLRELFGLDLRSLALFRVALASLLLVDLASRFRYLDVTATDRGVLPIRLVEGASLHALSGAYAFEVALLLLAALFALALLVGVATRWAALGSWLLLLSLLYRNPYLTDGGDVFASKLLLWSVFLPLGARFSLGARAIAPRTLVVSAATLGLICEFVHLYLSAGLVKASPEWRSTFTALEQVMGQRYWLHPTGEWLSQYPALLRAMTPLVVVFEVAAPLLLFVPVATGPVRCAVIAALWGFQLGLGLCIHLNLFPWFSSAATLALVPGWLWDRLGVAPGGSGRVSAPERASAGSNLAPAAVLLLFALSALPIASSLPQPLRRALDWTGISHRWRMYATAPTHDFRFDVRATLADGSGASLLDAELDGAWSRVREAHETYRLKYFLQKVMRRPEVVESYLAWLCREWNERREPGARVESARLFVEVWRILPRSDPRRHLLGQVACASP
jgi:hypothetical protein